MPGRCPGWRGRERGAGTVRRWTLRVSIYHGDTETRRKAEKRIPIAGAEERFGRNRLRSPRRLRRCGLSGRVAREPCGKRRGRLPAAAMVRGRADGVWNPAAFLPETFFPGRRARTLLVEHSDSNTVTRTPGLTQTTNPQIPAGRKAADRRPFRRLRRSARANPVRGRWRLPLRLWQCRRVW